MDTTTANINMQADSDDKNLESLDGDEVFDSVFEMVADLLKNNRFPDSRYEEIPIPDGLSLSDEVVEISVHLEGYSYEFLLGGMSRVDAADSYPGHVAFAQMVKRNLSGKNVTITIWRVRSQL